MRMIESSTEFLINKPEMNLETNESFGLFWKQEGTKKVYEKFRFNENVEYTVVQNKLKEIQYDSVLEVGCGDASFSRPLFKTRNYIGIDISKMAIERARIDFPNDLFFDGDFLKAHLGEADLVIAIAVLDSVYNIDAVLEKLKRLTQKYLIFTTHYPLSDNNDHQTVFSHLTQTYTNRLSLKHILDIFPEIERADNKSKNIWFWKKTLPIRDHI